MAISLEPYAQFLWGFQHNIALKLESIRKMKTVFLFCLSSDSFCLITSHIILKNSTKVNKINYKIGKTQKVVKFRMLLTV